MFYRFVCFLGYLLTKTLFFLRAEGEENIPKTGGAVICANHRSLWDAILIAVTMRRPLAFIAKEELFKTKLFSFVLRKLHCYPVRRDGHDLAVVKTALSLLKKGELLVIFPEGERIRKGKTPNLKPGAFRLAVMASVPLVPAGICGNFRFFRRMRVRYGESMETAAYKGQRLTEEEYAMQISSVMEKVYALAEEVHHD